MKHVANDNLVIVGTAHISAESVKEVEQAIAEHKPDIVAIELDANRLKALLDEQSWESTKIVDLIKGGNAFFFLAQIFMGSVQRKLGEKLGVKPGSEMLAAVNAAKEKNMKLELVDRDIGITMKKAYVSMSTREKMRLLWHFTKAMVGFEDEDEEEIDLEELMKEDVITMMIEELQKVAPSVTEVLIFERDTYLAKKIDECSKRGKVVAVVGAGHMKGIKEKLADIENTPSFESLEAMPKRSNAPLARGFWTVGLSLAGIISLLVFFNFLQPDTFRTATALLLAGFTFQAVGAGLMAKRKHVGLLKLLGYSIPIIIVALILWLVYKIVFLGDTGSVSELQSVFLTWFLINGIFSAIGAALALGHPASIATAFFAAPFTSLHPGVAAGWFAGYVEAKVRSPTVGDFKGISTIERFRDFYTNKVVRVLMVTALANVGSAIATWVAAGLIFSGHNPFF